MNVQVLFIYFVLITQTRGFSGPVFCTFSKEIFGDNLAIIANVNVCFCVTSAFIHLRPIVYEMDN